MRSVDEQALVHAILDAEIGMDEIADRAKSLGASLAERLNIIARNLVKLRVAGQISAERAAYFYKQAYLALTLRGFVEVAQDVKTHGDESVNKIAKLAKAYWAANPDKSRMALVTQLEKEQRKKEADGGGQS